MLSDSFLVTACDCHHLASSTRARLQTQARAELLLPDPRGSGPCASTLGAPQNTLPGATGPTSPAKPHGSDIPDPPHHHSTSVQTGSLDLFPSPCHDGEELELGIISSGSCVHDCASEADASVVDQDVHVTQGLQDLLSSIYHSFGVREVKHHSARIRIHCSSRNSAKIPRLPKSSGMMTVLAEFELLQSELQDRPLLGRYWEILAHSLGSFKQKESMRNRKQEELVHLCLRAAANQEHRREQHPALAASRLEPEPTGDKWHQLGGCNPKSSGWGDKRKGEKKLVFLRNKAQPLQARVRALV
ncbi:hypothetical protein DV515_00013459 [Chloebia gouldiae]|uniref:Uncharacterized protein n=1 Tax=Chloebia gouldiae TaxID=44316 RepID=A0A3L8S1B3_CHLGU|nr:hypothetical protein DV515_00013459 [Chloebia gouldiae]